MSTEIYIPAPSFRAGLANVVSQHSNSRKLLDDFNVGLKTLLSEGLSEPEFYGDLVYKFKKLIGINDFSFQFRKIITRYRRIGYNLNVMRQSACLVFNPIMVDNYAAFTPGPNWCFSFAPELVGYWAPRDLHRRAAYSICESLFLIHQDVYHDLFVCS